MKTKPNNQASVSNNGLLLLKLGRRDSAGHLEALVRKDPNLEPPTADLVAIRIEKIIECFAAGRLPRTGSTLFVKADELSELDGSVNYWQAIEVEDGQIILQSVTRDTYFAKKYTGVFPQIDPKDFRKDMLPEIAKQAFQSEYTETEIREKAYKFDSWWTVAIWTRNRNKKADFFPRPFVFPPERQPANS